MDFAIALLLMLPAFALGWCLLWLIAPLENRVLKIALGCGLGVAISSAIYFLLMWAGLAGRGSILACELVLLAAAIALLWKRSPAPTASAKIARPSWIWIPRVAALLGLCLFAMDFSNTVAANPDGQYDAAAIWNLRARDLAAGSPAWRYAVSDRTGTDHPGYPLLTSAFIARTWVLEGDATATAPAALALLFTLATFAVLLAGVATVAGEAAGWFALLMLLASEGYTSQAATQYADVPLSFYIVAATAFLAIAESRERLPRVFLCGGLFAGCAAWTKNEGIVFAALFAAIVWWRCGRRSLLWTMLGAAPGLLLTAAFKIFLVEGREAMFPRTAAQMLHLIADPARWIEIVKSFAHNFWDLGFPWAHPILLAAILAWACGLVHKRWSLLAAPASLLAADFAIYLISADGLTWHLGTSNNRVIAQVWPAMLFGFAAMLRAPAVETKPMPSARKSRR